MIFTIFSLILLTIGTILFILIARSIKKHPIVPLDSVGSAWCSTVQMAKIEKDFENLTDVYLKADQIELVTKDNFREILDALIDNFIEGINYNFIVPSEYYKSESKKINNLYNSIRDMANQFELGSDHTLGNFNLVSDPIKQYHSDYPYLFYVSNQENSLSVTCFRGEEMGVGISNNYRRLEPEPSRTMFLRILPFFDVVNTQNIRESLSRNELVFIEKESNIPLRDTGRQYDFDSIQKEIHGQS